jgi:hypothetical protein
MNTKIEVEKLDETRYRVHLTDSESNPPIKLRSKQKTETGFVALASVRKN